MVLHQVGMGLTTEELGCWGHRGDISDEIPDMNQLGHLLMAVRQLSRNQNQGSPCGILDSGLTGHSQYLSAPGRREAVLHPPHTVPSGTEHTMKMRENVS